MQHRCVCVLDFFQSSRLTAEAQDDEEKEEELARSLRVEPFYENSFFFRYCDRDMKQRNNTKRTCNVLDDGVYNNINNDNNDNQNVHTHTNAYRPVIF